MSNNNERTTRGANLLIGYESYKKYLVFDVPSKRIFKRIFVERISRLIFYISNIPSIIQNLNDSVPSYFKILIVGKLPAIRLKGNY